MNSFSALTLSCSSFSTLSFKRVEDRVCATCSLSPQQLTQSWSSFSSRFFLSFSCFPHSSSPSVPLFHCRQLSPSLVPYYFFFSPVDVTISRFSGVFHPYTAFLHLAPLLTSLCHVSTFLLPFCPFLPALFLPFTSPPSSLDLLKPLPFSFLRLQLHFCA